MTLKTTIPPKSVTGELGWASESEFGYKGYIKYTYSDWFCPYVSHSVAVQAEQTYESSWGLQQTL